MAKIAYSRDLSNDKLAQLAQDEFGPFASAAVELRNLGLAVMPVGGDDGKVPLIKSWQKYCFSTDALEEMARQPSKRHANIGVNCGRSGVTIVDIDREDLLAAMLERFGDTPLITKTPSGGYHLWYRSNGEGCTNLRKEGLNVDIKGKGGFVVAPPSIRPSGQYAGKAYEFHRGSWDDLKRLPTIKPGSLPSKTKPVTTTTAPKGNSNEGERNERLFALALRKVPLCDSLTSLRIVLMAANDNCCNPPLALGEVLKIAGSAWRYEQERRNFVGRESRTYVTKSEFEKLMEHEDGLDALALLTKFRFTHSGLRETFAASPAAMWKAGVMTQAGKPWGRDRYKRAIRVLLETKILKVVHAGGRRKGDVSLYSFCDIPSLTGIPAPILTNTLYSLSPPPGGMGCDGMTEAA
jgi:hypothetical protein